MPDEGGRRKDLADLRAHREPRKQSIIKQSGRRDRPRIKARTINILCVEVYQVMADAVKDTLEERRRDWAGRSNSVRAEWRPGARTKAKRGMALPNNSEILAYRLASIRICVLYASFGECWAKQYQSSKI